MSRITEREFVERAHHDGPAAIIRRQR